MFALIYNVIWFSCETIIHVTIGIFSLISIFTTAANLMTAGSREDDLLRIWYNSLFGSSYEDELYKLNSNNTPSHLRHMYRKSKNENHFVTLCSNDWSFSDGGDISID